MTKKITFKESLLIITILIAILGVAVIKFQLSPITPIILAITLLLVWARFRRFSWDTIHAGITNGVSTGIIPMLIFLLIGALIATWIAAGIIPTMMVVGFKLVNISFFIPSTFIVCAIIGTAIGSAFTTASTIGLALMGMGVSLGFNPALIAGAIVSGAVFGDKMSPLSDSTNLSAAIAGTDLFKHIRNLMWTTVPALLISLVLFFILGKQNHPSGDINTITELTTALTSHFSIGWWSALPIILMIGCSLVKLPAIPTLLINIFLSIGLMLIQEPTLALHDLSGIIENGFVSKIGIPELDALLSRGGLASMLGSISLILLTLTLGGLLINFGIIEGLMAPIIPKLKTSFSLIATTLFAGTLTNIMIGEQYLAIILPGNAMKPAFDQSSLAPTALSRALEDSGAVLNALIPWGVSGVFMAQTLGVSTLAYLPFCFFNLFCPVLSLLSGATGIGLSKKSPLVTE